MLSRGCRAVSFGSSPPDAALCCGTGKGERRLVRVAFFACRSIRNRWPVFCAVGIQANYY